MDITYVLQSDIITDEENNDYIVYGITAINLKGKTLVTVSDIFFDKEKAEEFVALCNSEKVELIHLQDISEDLLN